MTYPTLPIERREAVALRTMFDGPRATEDKNEGMSAFAAKRPGVRTRR